METLHRRKETAKALNIHTSTLDRYVREGRINCYQFPGGPRFSTEQIQEFILSTERSRVEAVKAQVAK